MSLRGMKAHFSCLVLFMEILSSLKHTCKYLLKKISESVRGAHKLRVEQFLATLLVGIHKRGKKRKTA